MSAEDDHITEILNGNKQQTDNKLNKLIVKFAKLHSGEKINKMATKRNDKEPKVI